MNYSKDDADRLLKRLEQAADRDPEFSESDMEALHEIVQAWRGWVALGRGAKWVITVLGLIAAAVASWQVLTKALKDGFGS